MPIALLLALLQDPAFDSTRLESRHPVDRVVVCDVDSDGRPDLLLQCGREIRLHRQPESGPFPAAADQVLVLSPETFLWNVLPSSPTTSPIVAVLTSRGIGQHRLQKGAFFPLEERIVHPTVFEGISSDRAPPVLGNFAPDLDGDGRPEWILPQSGEVWIFQEAASGELTLRQKLPTPSSRRTQTFSSHRFQITTSLPWFSPADFNGDGRTDLLQIVDESLQVHLQQEKGVFAPAVSLDLTGERGKRGRRLVRFEVPPILVDFNRDGTSDLALAHPSKGRLHIHYARHGRTDFSTPDQVLKLSEGWIVAVHTMDINRDGRNDLVIGGLQKLDLLSGVQAFLSKTVDIDLLFHLAREDGSFSVEPDEILSFTIPFTFQATRESVVLDLVFRPVFGGDYDGDGLLDVLVRENDETLALYRGDAHAGVQGEPTARIPFSPPAATALVETTVHDLNGDGRSDVILEYVTPGADRHFVDLQISRKP